jgi:hypothetical protein
LVYRAGDVHRNRKAHFVPHSGRSASFCNRLAL